MYHMELALIMNLGEIILMLVSYDYFIFYISLYGTFDILNMSVSYD